MPNIVKNLMVNEYMDRFGEVHVCVLVDYQGLSADQFTRVRKELTDEDLDIFVLKNSIAQRVFDRAGKGSLNEYLTQPAAIIYGKNEPVHLARTVTDLEEENEPLSILGGIVDRTPLDPENVEQLSDMETREQLIAKLAQGMMSPLQNLAQGLSSPVRQLARGLDDLATEGDGQEE